MRFKIVVALVAALVLTPTVEANNNFFLPGDAFYPTEVTADVLRKLQTDGAEGHVFSYSNFGGYEGAFCGYAGYSRAKIPAVDRLFVANLAKAYDQIREYEQKRLVEIIEDGKAQLIETNGMRVLFYPKGFEFPRFKIGLQYNEKWVEETVKFGHLADHIRLCELVDDKDAVIESWRDSTKVGSFEVLLPKVELDPTPVVEEPIAIKGPIKAIVLRSRPLKEYFSPSEYGTGSVLVVDSTGITRFEFEKGEWKMVAEPE